MSCKEFGALYGRKIVIRKSPQHFRLLAVRITNGTPAVLTDRSELEADTGAGVDDVN